MKKDIHIEINSGLSVAPGYSINRQPQRAGIMIDARNERQAILFMKAALTELEAEEAAKPPIIGRLELVR